MVHRIRKPTDRTTDTKQHRQTIKQFCARIYNKTPTMYY